MLKQVARMGLGSTLILGALLQADEGMWTLDNPPNRLMEERYGFTASAEWLKHVQSSALRFSSGGSGSFVSADGLVMTNHHVVVGSVQTLSSPEEDLVKHGFYAESREAERKCEGLELYQLKSFDDVTDVITKALGDLEGDAARDAKRAATSKLKEQESERTGLRCEVVELYQGGEYWVYRYKVYSDVRLVMAPEASSGFYGKEWDNFTYPRYCLDFAFLRAYEDGKPVKPEHWFSWSESGAEEGELTFIAGHPGSTDRGLTMTQVLHQRDWFLPFQIERMKEKLEVVEEYVQRGEEEKRRANRVKFGSGNYLKKLQGLQLGLGQVAVMKEKQAREDQLKKAVMDNPELAERFGSAWEEIDAAYAASKDRQLRDLYALNAGYRAAELMAWGESIVRYVVEITKPSEERLDEFAEAELERFRHRLLASKSSYPDLEEVLLAFFLSELVEHLGEEDPLVKDVLGGRTPQDVAKETAHGTRLGDLDYRKKLAGMSVEELKALDDPAIQLCWVFDKYYRQAREWNEENLWIVETLQGARIAKAKFALHGKGTYPDATFSLRLTYGKPARYESGSTLVPYRTMVGGLYARHDAFGGEEPFDLSDRLLKARSDFDAKVPLNFVTTHDITGGNSGSPVFNRDLEIVGVIFDSNMQGIANDYAFSEESARSISVHSGGMLEALRSVYGMEDLAEELTK